MTQWQNDHKKRPREAELDTPTPTSVTPQRGAGALPQWEEPAEQLGTASAPPAAALLGGRPQPSGGGTGTETAPLRPGQPGVASPTAAPAGPLAGLVGRLAGQLLAQRAARLQSGQIDQSAELGTMKELAFQVASGYRGLGANAHPAHLAAALQQLPEAGDRAMLSRAVIGLITATRPGERAALERALTDPQATLAQQDDKEPTGPAEIKTADPKGKLSQSGPAANGAAVQPAAPSPQPQPAQAEAKQIKAPPKAQAKAVASVPHHKPQNEPGKAPPPLKTASAKAKSAQAKKANPTAQAGSKGGAAKVSDLKVIPQNFLKQAGLDVQPTATKGDEALFEPREWRKAQAAYKALQAKKPAPTDLPTLQDTPQAARPNGRPAPKGQQGNKARAALPAETIQAAELQQRVQENRKENQKTLQATLKAAAKHTRTVDQAAKRATPKVNAAARAAQGKVTAALNATLAAINASASSATSRVNTAASSATNKVTAAHKATVNNIKKTTTNQRQAVNRELQTLKSNLTKAKLQLDQSTEKQFAKAVAGMISAGSTVGGEAISLANARAATYASEPLPEQSGWEDFKNGEDYPKKKRQAKVDAAKGVGKSFDESFRKSAAEQAKELPKSKGEVLQGNADLLKNYVTALDDGQKTLLKQIDAAEKAALTQADNQKTNQLNQIRTQKQSALKSIQQIRTSLQAQARKTATSQQRAIGQQSAGATRAIAQQATQARAAINKQVQAARTSGTQNLDQDAAAFRKSMQGLDTSLAGAAQKAGQALTTTATQSATKLSSAGTKAATSIKQIGTQARTQLNATANSSAQGIQQVATQAKQAFDTQTRAYSKQAKDLLTKVKAGFKATAEKFDADTFHVAFQLGTKLREAVTGFTQGLRDAKDNGTAESKAEDPTITEEAQKAADAVQPRWKAVVSVIIDIVVMIAVTAVMMALAATGIGVIAMIGLGILIGAASAVATQAMKDVLNGQFSGWKAYGAAALGGAIGGAFGGAGGAAANAITKGMAATMGKGLASRAAQFGVDQAINTSVGLVGEVASGYTNQFVFDIKYDIGQTFSAQNIATSLAMNVAGSGLSKIGSTKRVSDFINTKAGNLTAKFQSKFPNLSSNLSRFNTALDNKVLNSRFIKGADSKLTNFGEKLGSIGGKDMPAAKTSASGANTSANLPDSSHPMFDPANTRGGGQSSPNRSGVGDPTPTSNPKPVTDTTPSTKAKGTDDGVAPTSKPKVQNDLATPKPGDSDLSNLGYQPKPGERSTTREQYKAQQHEQRMAARQQRAQEEFNAKFQDKLNEIPDSPQKQQALEILKQVESMDFGTTKDQAAFYSGPDRTAYGSDPPTNRDLALQHQDRGGNAIDGTPGGQRLSEMDLYKQFDDARLADLIWMKASQKYANGASGNIHLFVAGADPVRVFNTIEKPLLQGNPNVRRWNQYDNPNVKPTLKPSTDATPTTPKPGDTTPTTSKPTTDLATSTAALENALPSNMKGKVPIETDPTLSGNTVRVDYDFGPNGVENIRIKTGPNATPADIALHAQTVRAMQKFSGLQGRVRLALDKLKRVVGLDSNPRPGSRAWEAKLEVEKLGRIIQDRQAELAVTRDPARQAELTRDLDAIEAQLRGHEATLAKEDQSSGKGYVAMDSTIDADGDYDPISRSDEQLNSDLNPTPRTGETTEQAQTRVDAAQKEVDIRITMEQLGERPWRPHLATNDANYASDGAHTIERHGWDMTDQDLADRITGAGIWAGKRDNFSFKWIDEATANRTIQQHIEENWDEIRRSLATTGRYSADWDTGNQTGVGYYNENYRSQEATGTHAPPVARKGETSWARVTFLINSAGEPYIMTAFPLGNIDSYRGGGT